MKKNAVHNLSMQDVISLRTLSSQFGTRAIDEKKKMLVAFSKSVIDKVSVLKEYHDCLLFLLAYPESEELFFICSNELERVSKTAASFFNGNNHSKKTQLSNTGISNSTITANFTIDIVKWLSESLPNNISYHSCDAEPVHQKEILKLLIPAVEREAFDRNFHSIEKWLNAQTNTTDTLKKLIRFFENALPNVELRDYFYKALKVFVEIKVDEKLPSRTNCRIAHGQLFFHQTPFIKKIRVDEILSQKIPVPLKLSLQKKEQITATAKLSLLMLLRETDPVTYAQLEATELHDMGRGIKIALNYMTPNRRLPVESYVGYMAFKNNIPVAYGGGWIMRNFSRIGINVFEPFRGGESALLFAQIIRLYKHRFNVSVFEAEPYQIGKDNSDGIKSGAFWFYYRFGFRPRQPHLFKLAEEENSKILNDKSYRTNSGILKKLADSLMVLGNVNVGEVLIATAEISEAILNTVNNKFDGDRKKFSAYAKNFVVKSLNLSNRKINFESNTFTDLAAFLSLATNLNEWNITDKQNLAKLFELKENNSEYEYIIALQKHKKLWSEIYKSLHTF